MRTREARIRTKSAVAPATPQTMGKIVSALDSIKAAHGWSDAELGSRMGTPKTTIAGWRSGKCISEPHRLRLRNFLSAYLGRDSP